MATERDRMRKDMATRASDGVTLRRRLNALAVFLPHFERPDFEFGRWITPPAGASGDSAREAYDLSRIAMDFFEYCYDNGWIQGFAWPEWSRSKEAEGLRGNPDAVENATPMQLSRLLTTLVRRNRFVDGSLGRAYESGLITGIARRAAALMANPPEESDDTDWVTWWGLSQSERAAADAGGGD